MKNRTIYLRVGLVTIFSFALIAPLHSFAATPTTTYVFATQKDVFMTELQTSTQKSSGEEFIELYNNTDMDIDFADTAHAGKDAWKLQYFSGSKLATLLPASTSANGWTNPFRSISLTGTIAAHDYYVLAGDTYVPGSLDPDQSYSSTLADGGGALQLIDTTTVGTVTNVAVHDRIAWSNDVAVPPSAFLFPAPMLNGSLQRLPNDDGEYLNDGTSLTTYAVEAQISPKNVWQAPVTDVQDPPADDSGETSDPGDPAVSGDPAAGQGDVTETPPVSNDGLLAPQITELLPNPASPQTDEVDEYIELYNPNDAPFNLKGYTLETGSTTLHEFTFSSDTILEPQSYRALYAVETGLSLSNSGGQARLLDPSGAQLSQSDVYATAVDGMAWALDETDGTWKWTLSATPNDANNIVVPVAVAKAATKTVAKTAAKTTKATTAKVKGVSTVKAKKTTAKTTKVKATKTAATVSSVTPSRPAAHIHVAALAAVAILGVAYGIYEYRHDLANRIYQFRDNRAARRRARG